MNDGIEALKSNNTWTLVDRPTNANILGLNGFLERNLMKMA